LKPVQRATFPRLKPAADDDPREKELSLAVSAIDNARRQRAVAGNAELRRYYWHRLEDALARYNALLRGEPAPRELTFAERRALSW
jgi:hypothetical protein